MVKIKTELNVKNRHVHVLVLVRLDKSAIFAVQVVISHLKLDGLTFKQEKVFHNMVIEVQWIASTAENGMNIRNRSEPVETGFNENKAVELARNITALE